ncbi:MAG: acyl-CoA thioesterase [Planctomycetaceae bacterium]|jgi:acyl-CoA thioester hydrolase|nr:acyl-CoA thioesterase [Planctomycetaceae bacterium]
MTNNTENLYKSLSDGEKLIRKMFIEQSIKVKSYDVDYMQIVNNTVYVKWFEDLRTAILDRYFPLEEMMKENNTPILSETYVKYHRPITLKNKPVGKAWIEELNKSKWSARFEIVENHVLYCEGRQAGYFYNMEKKRPVRFPKEFIEFYNSL